MAKQFSIPLADLTSATTGTAVDVSAFDDKTLFVGGTFTATYSVEESPDGTLFVATQIGKTAAGAYVLDKTTKQVRVKTTAYTGGTVSGCVGGRSALYG
jgi:hypothetical protein